jgi:hypothetical protein
MGRWIVKMNKLLKDKRGVSTIILIFTGLLLLLVITSYYYFNTREKNLNIVLDDVLVLDEFNLEIAYLNFYLEDIFEIGVEESGGSSEGFIMAYLEELENYKLNEVYLVEELEQVENQISNIEINGDEFSLNLELEIVHEGALNVRYSYASDFVKVFK